MPSLPFASALRRRGRLRLDGGVEIVDVERWLAWAEEMMANPWAMGPVRKVEVGRVARVWFEQGYEAGYRVAKEEE